MHWMDSLERHRSILISGMVILGIAMLGLTAMRNTSSFDVFWHLRMGSSWIEDGLVPWIDHFSFTYQGQEIVGPPFVFQALLHYFVSMFGLEEGMEALKFVSFVSVFLLFTLMLRNLKAPVILWLLVLSLLVAFLQLRILLRPELISYSLSVVALMLYRRADETASRQAMLPIVLLMWFWGNYHSPILGYIIFFGLFVDIALRQIREKSSVKIWLHWLGWGVAVLVVGVLNPSLSHPLYRLLIFSPEWKEVILEYRSALIYVEDPAFVLAVLFGAATLGLLIWRKRFGHLIICAVLMFTAYRMSRLVTPAAIIILGIFTQTVMDRSVLARFKIMTKAGKAIISLVLVLFAAGSFYISTMISILLMEENKFTIFKFPVDVVDYMAENDIGGKIFNIYDIGGYLIYRLGPASTVYIDGRTDILYPIEHYRRWQSALANPEVLQADVSEYDIDHAILQNQSKYYSLIENSGKFSLDYVGAKFSLFSRGESNFPLLGRLLARPSCWKSSLSSQLQAELELAKRILPTYSSGTHYLEFSIEAATTKDSPPVTYDQLDEGDWMDPHRRLSGYNEIRNGNYPSALRFFASVQQKLPRDFLAGSMAMVLLKDWEVAEQLLDEVTTKNWPRIEYSDMAMLYRLLSEIRANSEFRVFNPSYVDDLKSQIVAEDRPTMGDVLHADLFCPAILSAP